MEGVVRSGELSESDSGTPFSEPPQQTQIPAGPLRTAKK
jgi:hypothetical protein